MSAGTEVRSVAVFCGSSEACDERYLSEAEEVGRVLARSGMRVVYGGGGKGLMGRVADGALASGGTVTGVIPRFMVEVEWAHAGLDDLRVVDDMHERKRLILAESDAVVALPGGCGTLEELFEAITWKRLGLYRGPIVIVNQDGFFDPALGMLDRCVRERFMNADHGEMWRPASRASDIPGQIAASRPWTHDAVATAEARREQQSP